MGKMSAWHLPLGVSPTLHRGGVTNGSQLATYKNTALWGVPMLRACTFVSNVFEHFCVLNMCAK